MALTPAVTSAVGSATQNINEPAASVATPEFPGPITTNHGVGNREVYPGGPGAPVPGPAATVSFFENLPQLASIPGDPGDTAQIYGHGAPQATFDSNAGAPFAQGSGPIADTHGFNTGGTARFENVPSPSVGRWWRRTNTGQTYNGTVTYDPTGKIVSVPNDRIDLDQYQGHNANANDPRWIPYSERPVYLNVAHEAAGYSQAGANQYSPSGQLSPVGANFWTNQSTVYEAPPDPAVSNVSNNSAPAAAVGFWG